MAEACQDFSPSEWLPVVAELPGTLSSAGLLPWPFRMLLSIRPHQGNPPMLEGVRLVELPRVGGWLRKSEALGVVGWVEGDRVAKGTQG